MAGTASTSTAQNKSIAIRAILLALLLAAANLWSLRHLGFGLEDPVGLLGLTGFAAAASFWLDYFLDKDAQDELSKPIRASVRDFLRRFVLATPTLILLYLLAGVAASLFSSVTVDGAPGVAVEIAALDDQATQAPVVAKADAAPRIFLANPFGRPLRISPKGYSSQVRTLFPLTGLTLSLDDFEPLPTLLLRPGAGALFGLRVADAQARAQYRVLKRVGDFCKEIAGTGDKSITRAAMIGVRRPIPSDLPPLWLLELQSAGTGDDARSEANNATLMLAWQTPQALKAVDFLASGDRIQVQVLQRDRLLGFADYTVTQMPFQDVLLTDGGMGVTPCPIQEGSAG